MQTSQNDPRVAHPSTRRSESSVEQKKKRLIELGQLLRRIEASNICYHVLNVERDAGLEEVQRAYRQTLPILFPPYSFASTLPEDIKARMERAADKAYQALKTLALWEKRSAYDQVTPTQAGYPVSRARDRNPDAQGMVSGSLRSTAASPTEQPPAKQEDSGRFAQPSGINLSAPCFSDYLQGAESKDSRRRSERIKLSLPVRVAGHDKKQGKWQQVTETIDLSRTGLNLRLRKYLRHGMVVYLTLPLPDKLRSHAYGAPSYNVYALVRRVGAAKNGVRVIGLEFIGEHPPMGYLEKPWMVFRTKSWSGRDRRRVPRKPKNELFQIEYFSEAGKRLAQETARGEDGSSMGLRLCVRMAPAEFDFVRVVSANRTLNCLAYVCNRFIGKDGMERLCLEFAHAPVDS